MTAHSLVRSRALELGLAPETFLTQDLHIHIPAGSIPKEGSSAGLTLALALLSLCTGKPLRRDVAMTGEITLTGHVLPVGGIREKILAAARAGAARVILPAGNKPEVGAMAEDELAGVEVVFVQTVEEALAVGLGLILLRD